MNKNRKNLFIEVHQPDLNYSHSSLINNWTLPIPQEFHIINSPALNQKLSHLVPRSSPNKLNKNHQKHLPQSKHQDRHKYHRLQQQLIFLQQFLLEFKDLRASQVLEYRQKLLVRYLSQFVQEINIECKEKGVFLQSIWNTFSRIFEQVFQRVVSDSKYKQKKSLKTEINLHQSYQNQLEMLKKHNQRLKREQEKTSLVISQLADNIAILNTKLKGSNFLIKQLSNKYEQLRSQHIQLLVTSNQISHAQAELRLQDQELLLFSKQANSQEGIKVKAKSKRKLRVMDNKLDVQMLLQQVQAESEFQFSIGSNTKIQQKSSFKNQKVQTIQFKKDIKEQQVQWESPYQIIQTAIQTDTLIKLQKTTENQTNDVTNLPKKQNQISACLSISFQAQIKQQKYKISVLSNTQNNQPVIVSSNQQPSLQKDGTATKFRNSISIKSRVSKNSETQVFRVGDSNRISKRGSNFYRQKMLKTEGAATDIQTLIPVLTRQSSQKRVSDLILIEQLRQDYIRNYGRFRKTSTKKVSLSEHIRLAISDQSDQQNEVSNFKVNKKIQNIHISSLYSSLIENITQAIKIDKKKKVTPGKCMKQVGLIFKMATKLINQGVFSLDLVSLAIQLLSAIQGRQLIKQQKQKKFIQFVISCIPLATISYLIKSFLLLCGLPFAKIYYMRANRAEKQREQQKLDKQSSKYVFSSQIYTYFKLLTLANCQDNEDILQAYTNQETFRNSLKILPTLYKGSSKLLEQLNLSIAQSIQHSQQKNPKLDIFKSLHLVLDKILGQKVRIHQSIQPLTLLIKQPNSQFVTKIISLLTTNSNTRYICSQVMKSSYSSNYTSYTLTTMALIEGLQIESYKFTKVQQQHKFTILKRLMFVQSHKDKLLQAMVKAIPKKQLRKQQFLVMLRLIWNMQTQKLIDDILGKDLKILNNIGIGLNLEIPPKDNFHSMAFDSILQ